MKRFKLRMTLALILGMTAIFLMTYAIGGGGGLEIEECEVFAVYDRNVHSLSLFPEVVRGDGETVTLLNCGNYVMVEITPFMTYHKTKN